MPAEIEHRREVPADPGRAHLDCRDFVAATNELRIPRRSHREILWKDGCTQQVIVAVYCIDPVQNRNPQSCALCRTLDGRDYVVPVLRCERHVRYIQNRSNM